MKTYTILRTIKLILILSLVVSCNDKVGEKNEKSPVIKNIDSLLNTSYERELFNGNVLIVKNDTITYQKSFGFTDGTQQKKLDNKSILNAGSIAKQFNGVAIMILQERGLLNIHDTISGFDLGLPDWSKKVTISHLLNYASGIPRIDPIEPANDDEAWGIIRSVDTLLFEPGTNFLYDNSNVFLQRRIIEKVTSQSFQEFVIENIIKPLKMTNVVFDPAANYPNRTSCYDFNKVQCPEMEFISGWLWLDVNELYKWVNALNSNTLISQESFNSLLINPYAKDMASSLGEYFKEEQLQRYNGTSYKFRSMLVNDFKNDMTIILLSNNGGLAFELGQIIHNIILGKEFEVPKKSIHQALKDDFIKSVDKGIVAYHNLKQQEPKEYDFENPKELNRLGVELFQHQKDIKELIKLFEFAVSVFPNDAQLNYNLGQMYFDDEEYGLALELNEKVLALGEMTDKAKMMIEKINEIKTKQ